MYVSVQFLFLFFLRFFPFLLFFHLPWPCVYAGKWLSWVESLMLFAEMFKLYTGICKKKNKTNKKKKTKNKLCIYRIFICASMKNLLFFLWSLQCAGRQIHVTHRTELLLLCAWLSLSLMKWDFPVSSGDEKEV